MRLSNELRRYADAAGFLTIVPVRYEAAPDADWLARCAKYFPLVGLHVGVCAAGVLTVAASLWHGPAAALMAVASAILVTGALHEDGLADAADGLCGGRTPMQRLAIMKDSRIGGYGALALIVAVGFKVQALAALPVSFGAAALVAAHAGGRLAAVLPMIVMHYAGDIDARKVTAGNATPDAAECAQAIAWAGLGLVPLFLLAPGRMALGLVLGAVAAATACWFAQRRIGGYTGDVLGASEQCFEIGMLLGAAAVV